MDSNIACLSASLAACLPTYMSARLPACLPTYMSARLPACMPDRLLLVSVCLPSSCLPAYRMGASCPRIRTPCPGLGFANLGWGLFDPRLGGGCPQIKILCPRIGVPCPRNGTVEITCRAGAVLSTAVTY